MLVSFRNTPGKEGRKMLFHFGFLLVLAAADQSQAFGIAVAQPSYDWNNCPQQNCYYRYGQSCDKYVECQNYQPSRKVCPDGMFFKENPSWSEYPCAKPPVAQCSNNEYASNNQDWNWPSYFTTQRIPTYTFPTKFDIPITLEPESWKPTHGYGDVWDFKCPKRYAFYRHEQSCDIYVECRNFQPSRKVCPDGMHFKESPLWSEYPCAYPPEAQCLSREFALPARPTEECPHQFGNYPLAVERYPSHDRCSSYISCASGVAHVMNCTFGLVFNPVINLCDWPEQVPGCQDTFDFYCPVPHLGEEDMVINYRYPQDPECRYFFSCLNGNYRVLACDEGLLFDHRIGRCVEYDDYICDN